jgi:RNA polymerase sigma factor (sigma-70 family)
VDFRQQCVDLLRSESEWPLPNLPFESLTYQFSKSEISFVRNEAIKINGIYRLRSIPQLDKTVYIVDLGSHNLHLFAIRRIAMAFTTSSRKYFTRKKESVENLIFIVIHSNGLLSIVHCQGENALSATMAVSGKEPGNHCPLFLAATQFSHIIREHWSLPPHLYVRYKRTRDPIKCIEETVDEHAPELMRLFIRAKRAPALTQSEEDILFYQLRDGSEKAKEKLITCHLILAFETAYRFYRKYDFCNISFINVFDGALEGLLLALDKYNPEESNRFRAFAWYWVYNRIDRNFSETSFPINFPTYIWEKASKVCLALPMIEYKLQASQSKLNLEDSVTQYLFAVAKNRNNLPAENYLERQAAIFKVAQFLSWQQPTTETVEFFDEFSYSTWGKTMNQLIQSDFIDLAGKKLRPMDLAVLQFRNGLHPQALGNKLTLEETGQRLKVTRERVRQIELRAKVRFKSELEQLLAQAEVELKQIDLEAKTSSPKFGFLKPKFSHRSSDLTPMAVPAPINSHQLVEPNENHDQAGTSRLLAFPDFENLFLQSCEKQIAKTDYKKLYYFLTELREIAQQGHKQYIPVSKLLKISNVKGRGYLKVKEIDTILMALNVKSVPHFNSVGIDDSIELIFD